MKSAILCLLLWLPSGAGTPVRPGADRILQEPYFSWIRGKRLGLITNQTGVDSRLRPLVRLLQSHPEVRLTALFAPEHGLAGSRRAGEAIAGQGRIYSLYGKTREPTREMLKDVDVLLYDVQDVGARYYTFISTLFLAMRAAARGGIPFLVLDRPDPIGGLRVEGPVLESGLESFVGIYPLPVRYGMTPGELALFFNREAHLGCRLKVVPLAGWKRSFGYGETSLQWIPPSPNMPTPETALLYPGFCLLEGTNLSEGRGTTHPFQWVGAPWLQAREVARRLNALHLPGVFFRPQSFQPTTSKYAGRLCRGIQVHVLDRERFRPVLAALHFLSQVHRLQPARLRFLDSFDRLAGNHWIRRAILAGEDPKRLAGRWQRGLEAFRQRRRRYLLY